MKIEILKGMKLYNEIKDWNCTMRLQKEILEIDRRMEIWTWNWTMKLWRVIEEKTCWVELKIEILKGMKLYNEKEDWNYTMRLQTEIMEIWTWKRRIKLWRVIEERTCWVELKIEILNGMKLYNENEDWNYTMRLQKEIL